MTVYAWPGWGVAAFELRVLPNTRTFVGPYTPSVQVIDLLGERWQGRIDLLPTVDVADGASREAFFDRLKGPVNQVAIWHFKLPAPLGTISSTGTAAVWRNNASAVATWLNASSATASWLAGIPALRYAVAQLANTATLQAMPGATMRAGSMFGLSTTQTVRLMADAVADGVGLMAVEFQPRARQAYAAYTPIVLNQPTINVMLKSADGVPTTWQPGYAAPASFEFVEVP